MWPSGIFQAKWVLPFGRRPDYFPKTAGGKLEYLVYEALNTGLEEKQNLADNQPKSNNGGTYILVNVP